VVHGELLEIERAAAQAEEAFLIQPVLPPVIATFTRSRMVLPAIESYAAIVRPLVHFGNSPEP
jgi:hypothetical protein